MPRSLNKIISNTSHETYHSGRQLLTESGDVIRIDGDYLLKFLTKSGIDIDSETPLTCIAADHYVTNGAYSEAKPYVYFWDEFYERLSDIVWICMEHKVDIKSTINTLLKINDLQRFATIWSFIRTSADYGVLEKFLSANKNFIATILNLESHEQLESVRRILITCNTYLTEIIAKKQQFINDLLALAPEQTESLHLCLANLSFNDYSKQRFPKVLFTCENILTLLDAKKIKYYAELKPILSAINTQLEFDMLVKQANNLPLIYQFLLKANNSSNEFKAMPADKFAATLRAACGAARLLNSVAVFFAKPEKDLKVDMHAKPATRNVDKTMSLRRNSV